MSRIFINQNGSALIASVFIVLAMGIAGMGMMQLSAAETSASADHIETTEAFYGGQGAIERVKHMLDWGQNPVGNVQVGSAVSSITTVPFERLASVVTQNGRAQVTQTINTDFSRDAIQFDTRSASISGNSVVNTYAIKSKLRSVTLTSMRVKWNQHSCVTGDVYSPEHDLSWCAEDDGGARLRTITFDGHSVYGTNIGTPNGGANSDELIDIVDYSFVANQAYSFDITFNQPVPVGTLVTVVFGFLDGSEIETTYQVFSGCELQYFARNNGRIEINANHQATFEVISRERTYGSGGNALNVTMKVGEMNNNGSVTYAPLFGGNYVTGGETSAVTSSSDKTYVLKATGTRQANFIRMHDSTNTLQVKTLVNGDQGPRLTGHSGNSGKPLAQFFDANDVAVLEPNQVLVLFELSQNLRPNQNSAAHYQDVAILITIDSTDPACLP